MSWNGVKRQSIKVEIEAWCEEMGIRNYTINSQGEIDVDGNVNLDYKDFKELPYKFGVIDGHFLLDRCKNLKSLKNCPGYVVGYFSCSDCTQLDSLEGCPKEVGGRFYCNECNREFTKEYVISLCRIAPHKVVCYNYN